MLEPIRERSHFESRLRTVDMDRQTKRRPPMYTAVAALMKLELRDIEVHSVARAKRAHKRPWFEGEIGVGNVSHLDRPRYPLCGQD